MIFFTFLYLWEINVEKWGDSVIWYDCLGFNTALPAFQSLLYISRLRLIKALLFNRRKIYFELRKVESDFLSLMRWLHRRSVWFRLYQIVCSVLQNKVLLFWEIFGQFSMNWKKGSSQTFQMSLQKGNKTCLHLPVADCHPIAIHTTKYTIIFYIVIRKSFFCHNVLFSK